MEFKFSFGNKKSNPEQPKSMVFSVSSGKNNIDKEGKIQKEEPTLLRRNFLCLENMYNNEPIMFTGINMYERCIKKTKPDITSEDTKTQNKIDEILKKGRFEKIMYGFVPIHLGICGNAWVGYIWNKNHTAIVDLGIADFKTMDFQRDSSNSVVFDEYGVPLGYTQKISGKKDTHFSRSEMEHLTLFQVNEGELGIGFIEPLYMDITLKENIEQAKGKMAYRKGSPLPDVEYGSKDDPPTEEMATAADTLAKEIADEHTIYTSHPYYLKPGFLESKSSEQEVVTELMYTTKLQAGVLGVPLARLLNSIENEGGKGFDALTEYFSYNLTGFQESEMIYKIMSFMLESNNCKGEIIVKWKPLSDKQIKEEIMGLMRLSKGDLIYKTPKMSEYLWKKLGHPPLEVT